MVIEAVVSAASVASATLATRTTPKNSEKRIRVNVLLVEDDLSHAVRLRHTLPCDEFHVRHVGRFTEARNHLGSDHYDVVLLDLDLPNARRDEAVRHMLRQAPGAPIVGLTARADTGWARTAPPGIRDCILKGETSANVIGGTMRHAIERTRMLAELDEAHRKVEAKQRLLDIVSHEIRNPLHIARLSLSGAMDCKGLPAECHDELSLADRSLVQVANMIGDLLDAARTEHETIAVQTRSVDASRLVHDTVAAYQRVACERPAVVMAAVDAGLPLAVADPKRLRQILTNLLDNALKFTRPHTTIVVGAQRSTRSLDAIEFSVTDHGPGVDLVNAPRLFERFYQGPSRDRQVGLGLGLFICRALVAGHGGSIWVENVSGEGARFAFTIPCAPLGGGHVSSDVPTRLAAGG
jgi:signal transduction histidine kinase